MCQRSQRSTRTSQRLRRQCMRNPGQAGCCQCPNHHGQTRRALVNKRRNVYAEPTTPNARKPEQFTPLWALSVHTGVPICVAALSTWLTAFMKPNAVQLCRSEGLCQLCLPSRDAKPTTTLVRVRWGQGEGVERGNTPSCHNVCLSPAIGTQ